jgi:hypothetical protein
MTGTLTMKKKLAALMPISVAVTDCSSPVLRALPIRSNACLCTPLNVATSTLLRSADRMRCRVYQRDLHQSMVPLLAARSCLNLLAADRKWPGIIIIKPQAGTLQVLRCLHARDTWS